MAVVIDEEVATSRGMVLEKKVVEMCDTTYDMPGVRGSTRVRSVARGIDIMMEEQKHEVRLLDEDIA